MRDERCGGFDADVAYAAMDFLLDALGEIAAGVFDTTATLLNLSCDVIFVDTTSTYWESRGAVRARHRRCSWSGPTRVQVRYKPSAPSTRLRV